MGYTHNEGFSSNASGFAVGRKGAESRVINQTGNIRQLIAIPLGAVTTTTSMCAFIAPCAGTIESVKVVNKTAITKNDTNYWTFALTNKGVAGTGTDVVATVNTKATGGSAMTAYVPLALAVDTAKNTLASGATVLASVTIAASATALAETLILIDFKPS